jgi:hypothetical protein
MNALSNRLSQPRSRRQLTNRKTAAALRNVESRPMFESLEDRQLMSAALPTAKATTTTTSAATGITQPLRATMQAAAVVAPATATASEILDDVNGRGGLRIYLTQVSAGWPAGRDYPGVDFQIDGEKMQGTFFPSATPGKTCIDVSAEGRGMSGTAKVAHKAGATITRIAPGATVPAPVTDTSTQFVNIGGALWAHKGIDPNAGWSKLWDTGIKQVSASRSAPDTCFVLFTSGALYEHVGLDKNSGWFKLWDTAVKQISAGTQNATGTARADVCFVLFDSGALYEHVGRDKSLGWSKLWDNGITQISASQYQVDTVYCNFNGAAWEHNGRDLNSGWTRIWSAGIGQVEASQTQFDTCFTIFSGTGALYEHTGKDANVGWSKLWDTGIKQVSPSFTKADSAFVLFTSGALYDHTGLSLNAGWSKLYDSGITQIAAAAKTDTVLANFNGALWQHNGLDRNSGWIRLWSVGVTNMDAGQA